MVNWIAVGICAGLAAAVLQAVVVYPSPVTMLAFYLSALPIFVVALGWGLSATAVAGVSGGLAIAATGLHATALVADTYVHFGAADVLVPFASSWRPLAVAINARILELINEFNIRQRRSVAAEERGFVEARREEAGRVPVEEQDALPPALGARAEHRRLPGLRVALVELEPIRQHVGD